MALSFLLISLLNNDKTNKITASVIGSRKRENGLVVPCLYRATTQKLKVAMVLHKELMSAKEMCQHMDIIVKEFENNKKFALTDFIRRFCIDSAKESSLFCWVLIPQYTTPT